MVVVVGRRVGGTVAARRGGAPGRLSQREHGARGGGAGKDARRSLVQILLGDVVVVVVVVDLESLCSSTTREIVGPFADSPSSGNGVGGLVDDGVGLGGVHHHGGAVLVALSKEGGYEIHHERDGVGDDPSKKGVQ